MRWNFTTLSLTCVFFLLFFEFFFFSLFIVARLVCVDVSCQMCMTCANSWFVCTHITNRPRGYVCERCFLKSCSWSQWVMTFHGMAFDGRMNVLGVVLTFRKGKYHSDECMRQAETMLAMATLSIGWYKWYKMSNVCLMQIANFVDQRILLHRNRIKRSFA